MRLLICTQAVDQDDPVLGFFVRWIKEFAAHCEQVTVVCLRTGAYSVPQHVSVISLTYRPRLGRALELLYLMWRLRRQYDAVFVHMNPEYLVVAGPLWRLLGKRIALWYTHKAVTWRLRIAELWTNVALTASPESFRLPSRKIRVLGHGIDADFFAPDSHIPRETWWLSVGRLTKSKRHDLAIREAGHAGKELRIIGEGPERQALEKLAREQATSVVFLGGLSQHRLRDEYRRASKLIHRSETGSLDKVVLEAAATGLPVDTTDPALSRLPLSPEFVRAHHSLSALIPRILKALYAGAN